MMVGPGAAGKTTLVTRLAADRFDDTIGMTDGVCVSPLVLGDVQFSVLDFAGQVAYRNTHQLFFDDHCVYVAVHMPRVDSRLEDLFEYLQMVYNRSPEAAVLLVCTRSDECVMSEEAFEMVRRRFPRVRADRVSVDSKSGRGIAELKQLLATCPEILVQEIPSTFLRVEQELGGLADAGTFSLSLEAFHGVCRGHLVDQSESMLELVLSCLVGWGVVFSLSDGSVVLRPQQLADVLACVFTHAPETHGRIGDVRAGVLVHSEASLRAVWAAYPESLWRVDEGWGGAPPPLVQLLYSAGLAYELFDETGARMGASLLPALLPMHPLGWDLDNAPSTMSGSEGVECERALRSLFIAEERSSPDCNDGQVLLELSWLPTTLMGQLIVGLQSQSTLGGAWQHGCCLSARSHGSGGAWSQAIVWEHGGR